MARTWLKFFFIFVCLLSPLRGECRERVLPGDYTSGELIIKFKQHGLASASHKTAKASVKRRMKRLRTDLVSLPATLSVKDAIRLYQKDPNVEYAEPNYIVRKAATPNDPRFSDQWNMAQIGAPRAWDIFSGSSAGNSLVVAVLDTGIDYTHLDLSGNLWTNAGEIPGNGIDDDHNGIVDDYYGASFRSGIVSGNPADDDTADSHGTHVAGIIGAVGNNAAGVAGVNWQVRMMAVKFLHGAEGFGELSDALLGIEYAVDHGAKIINCSFEVADDPGLTAGIQSIKDALAFADKSGVLVVSAAGNTGADLDRTSVYPASVKTPGNIAVAATGVSGLLTYYSDYGKTVVSVAAPGGDATDRPSGILSTVSLTNSDGSLLQYRTTAGTSMAAPHVAGLAALIWNYAPTLDHYQVKARILNSVDKHAALAGLLISGGRINAEKALKVADIPAVFTVEPNRLIAGAVSAITVTGANFGSSPGGITLAGTPLVVTSWSEHSIAALVPAAAMSGELQVDGMGSGFPVTVVAVPKIAVTATPANGKAPLEVTFKLAFLGSDIRVAKYEWDFGDGIYSEITGLASEVTSQYTSGGTYQVRARVTDDLGQIAEAVTTVEVSGGDGSAGGCFIATAAYGSYLHPKVVVLRAFRDQWLLTNSPGRGLVSLYYRYSPPLADCIAGREWLKALVRLPLLLLVTLIESPSMILLLPGCFVLLRARRRARPSLSR